MTRPWRPPDARGLRLVCSVVLLLAACAPSPSVAPSPTDPGLATPPSRTASPPPTTGPAPAGSSVRVYLVLGFGGQTGLVPVERGVAAGTASPERAAELLLRGPIDAETAARPAVYTAIPTGVELRSLTIDGSVATVDLSAAFEAPGEDGLPTAMRVAQVAYTLTEFPWIDTVQIRIEGALVTVLGPDRFPQDRPLRRADFTAQLPPLFIDVPSWGATIASPVRIAGLANAFEATFQVRIADAGGRGLAAGPVTASCGTGCWGEFDVSVPFSVQVAGPGVLQAFELSPRDGTMDNLREYPVTLTP